MDKDERAVVARGGPLGDVDEGKGLAAAGGEDEQDGAMPEPVGMANLLCCGDLKGSEREHA